MIHCRTCGRSVEPDLALIEEFLNIGINGPPSRATKDELEQWITRHTALMSILRDLLLRTIPMELHNRATSTNIQTPAT